MDKTWTIVELLDATKTFFEKKGIGGPDSPGAARLDAELLLAKVLGCRRIDLYVRFDRAVTASELSEFRELARQRGERRPTKQLLGRCEFRSREFEITPDVLIPRPETEAVVENALAALGKGPQVVVDLGTGSGNIAVSIAVEREDAKVYATDISGPALEVARRNAKRHGVGGRIDWLEGDLFAPLPEGVRGAVDCVVSNPPYVAESEWPGLMPEVARYEPRIALLSGQDGAGHVLQVVAGSTTWLRSGGALVVELSPSIAARAHTAAEEDGAYIRVRVERDLAGLERVLIAEKR